MSNIKNGNMPAMPLVDGGFGRYEPEVYSGLTKREMFAMNAPKCPEWFIREFSMIHSENKDYYNLFHDEFAPICPTTHQEILPKGEMALIKEWRYAYADLMLADNS